MTKIERSKIDMNLIKSNLMLQEMRTFIAWFNGYLEGRHLCPKQIANETLMSKKNCHRCMKSLEAKKVIERNGFFITSKNQNIIKYKFTGYFPKREVKINNIKE